MFESERKIIRRHQKREKLDKFCVQVPKFFFGQMKKMMLDGKISDYSMYNSASNWSSAAGCQYPTDTNSSNSTIGFSELNHSNKNQVNNDCNINHYCQNPKFDHLANHWNESMAAMHQQAQHDPNYFRNQWQFSGAATNSYHVNDTTTISNIPSNQSQHCLLIPHAHFHHPSSAGKSICI